jgi:CheY-like chemotaxis protein
MVRPDHNKIVLVVDDEEPIRKLSRLIVEKAGYRVLLASSSQEALSISRGYSEQIDLLLSDVEMPGMNGLALARQITVERPGIAVLLNSANPTYVLETQFAFVARPFSPAKLQIAIAQTLESQPRALAQVELEPIPPMVTKGSCARPEIRTAEMQTVEAPWGRDSRQVLPEPERRLPEAVVLNRGNHQNSSNIDFSIIRTAKRNLAIAVSECKSRWRLLHAIPVWVPAVVALVLSIVPFSLDQITEGPFAKPYTVGLQGMRGLAGEAEAPTGKPLLFDLDVTSLPRSDAYEIQIVNEDGHSLWRNVVPAQGSAVQTKAAALRPGTYFVRVYGPAGELLKEYALRVTETH